MANHCSNLFFPTGIVGFVGRQRTNQMPTLWAYLASLTKPIEHKDPMIFSLGLMSDFRKNNIFNIVL